MANIFKSSIGKKLIMSISGLFLVIFLLVHMACNITMLISDDLFRSVCNFMSTPVVTIMVPVLAFGLIIHFIYAFIITIQNKFFMGGSQRYEVATKTESDSWASKNMFVIGFIVLCILAFHFTQFWANMQLKDFMGVERADAPMLVYHYFGNIWFCIIYILWFAALWFHLSHGFWSAFHTLGWNNNKWLHIWQVIAKVYATIIFLGFTAIPVYVQIMKCIHPELF